MMTRTFLSDGKSFIEETKQLPTFPEKPEPTQAERDAARQADRWRMGEMLTVLKWTIADFELAGGYGFPKPIARAVTGWAMAGDGEPIFSRSQVMAWRERFKEFAAKVR